MLFESDMKTFKATVLFSYFLILVGCATGSHIITGEVRPAIEPNEVKLYLDPPSEYETIGIVEASSDVELSSQAMQDRAIQELKSQAAQIGANGVLITNTGNESKVSGDYSYEAKTARGKAIFVNQK